MPGVREVGQIAVAHMVDGARHRGNGSEERQVKEENFEGSLKLSLWGLRIWVKYIPKVFSVL